MVVFLPRSKSLITTIKLILRPCRHTQGYRGHQAVWELDIQAQGRHAFTVLSKEEILRGITLKIGDIRLVFKILYVIIKVKEMIFLKISLRSMKFCYLTFYFKYF